MTEHKCVENASAWSGLQTIVEVKSEVFHKLSQKATCETRYYISSLQLIVKEKDSKIIAQAIRGDWGIEICLHWSLDVSFNEDKSRVRTGYSDQNLSAIRMITL
ncbi:ISAs1 family transposase [Spirosoma spitsbergense]|uniref:ISAs1 family transposase n=1 Tax=Spirosoma spitsbergense TaxID=431554 RepID=UPI00036AC3F7